jgi:hypothetical protein
VTDDRATWTYDDKRMSLVVCACGREVSNGAACQGVCLMERREQQIAANLPVPTRARREGA